MALADEFVRVYKETHPSDPVVELRLYDVAIPEIDLDLLSAWKKLAAGTPFVHLHDFEQNKATLFDNYTEQFLAADRVVIANPLWNPQVPTRLKAWIDTITRAGKTFNYGPTGEPIGLATGKRGVHLQTAGGVFGGQDPASQYVRTVLGFIGVTDFQQVAVEGVDHEPARADEFMHAGIVQVREVASTF